MLPRGPPRTFPGVAPVADSPAPVHGIAFTTLAGERLLNVTASVTTERMFDVFSEVDGFLPPISLPAHVHVLRARRYQQRAIPDSQAPNFGCATADQRDPDPRLPFPITLVVSQLVCQMCLTARLARRLARARSRGCRGRRGPRPSEDRSRVACTALYRPSQMAPVDSTLPAGVLMGCGKEGR